MPASAVTTSGWQDEVIASGLPVLVDLWAEWCGPCRIMSPVIDRAADSHAGRLKVLKLNVDENPDIARQYGVMSIPTLLLIRDGQETARIVGARTYDQLEKELSEHLT